ncbi:MAG: hypothetical protein JKY62_16750 [Desulfocapsa sp.]|nr:hypothetical protein [Desulfocapsa sp.]
MAFATASNITSLDAFISSFVAFAVANAGFTNESSITINGGANNLYRISKTVDTIKTYWWFTDDDITSDNVFSATRVLGRMMHVLPTEANMETLGDGQRYPSAMGIWDTSPNYTGSAFFTDGLSVFTLLEVTSGVFAHFSFGHITKASVFDGGAYVVGNNFQAVSGKASWRNIVDGSHNSSSMVFGGRANLGNSTIKAPGYVQFNLGGSDNKDFTKFGGEDHSSDGAEVGASGTIPPNYNSALTVNTSLGWSIWDLMAKNTPSEATFRAPLFPTYIVRNNPANIFQCQIIGHVPNVTGVNMKLLNNKDLVNTDWRVFSLAQKGTDGSSFTPAGEFGIAYREIP